MCVDQYELEKVHGRLPHDTCNKEKEEEQYCVGTIMVDHASCVVYLRCQLSLRAGKRPMLVTKQLFLVTKQLFEQLTINMAFMSRAIMATMVCSIHKSLWRTLSRMVRQSTSVELEHTTRMALQNAQSRQQLSGLVQWSYMHSYIGLIKVTSRLAPSLWTIQCDGGITYQRPTYDTPHAVMPMTGTGRLNIPGLHRLSCRISYIGKCIFLLYLLFARVTWLAGFHNSPTWGQKQHANSLAA